MAPRGFTDDEEKRIRYDLMQAGREKFGTMGLRKTSIKDLTEIAGIAQGSFYKFYESKELLYFRLLEQDEASINQTIYYMGALEKMDAEGFSKLLQKALRMIEERPLLRRVMVSDEYQALVRKLPADVVERHEEKDILSFNQLFHLWKDQGVLDGNLDSTIISGAIRALLLASTHKREIGYDVFDASIDFLIQSLAYRIFKGSKG
ncbi:TetR/AcrR family transcriptional regulator [Salipaludibacillus agaradhaerens]|uniref:TetR/AcrR family transcriptional regulator n=1 Tax=Salipaludibacillus agaradhaerens TaxID=76935 RepID=UPI0009964F95|nr:TetR/AcrR family transcriptional regulator [Salipaludibacillus agaradhaerens]MCR6105196.1 TetR/AcrR family transcriptional regulator [Salipaludibacillus agaradhaerens]MCR6117241.1 TetR/AcrR family transcriptional regulator [Salipaludibacillus agaradhaerens]UJW56435.1 TetR/AcrR family transcriptional regulator [Bacillus sp. A116_S68]